MRLTIGWFESPFAVLAMRPSIIAKITLLLTLPHISVAADGAAGGSTDPLDGDSDFSDCFSRNLLPHSCAEGCVFLGHRQRTVFVSIAGRRLELKS